MIPLSVVPISATQYSGLMNIYKPPPPYLLRHEWIARYPLIFINIDKYAIRRPWFTSHSPLFDIKIIYISINRIVNRIVNCKSYYLHEAEVMNAIVWISSPSKTFRCISPVQSNVWDNKNSIWRLSALPQFYADFRCTKIIALICLFLVCVFKCHRWFESYRD